MLFSSLFGHQAQQTPLSFGNYNPSGGGTYRLQSSIGLTNSSIALSSFKEPISNIPYTMSYLNSSIEYGTLDPQNTTSKEFISFTGITQNNDGTATLTGVVRGLGFSYPYTASTTLQQPHSGQSIFILSNPPQLTNQYANRNNNDLILGAWNFSSTSPPSYDEVGAQGNGTYISTTSELASVAYVNKIANQGTSNATESIIGISKLATQLQMASSTFNSNSPTVLYTNYSTSSPYKADLLIPITQNDGTLNPNFIATSSRYKYNWGSSNNFIASTTFDATTTIVANNINSNAVIFNNLAYAFPSVRAASTTVLSENGSGSLTWEPVQTIHYSQSGTFGAPSINNAGTGSNLYATSSVSMTIPAGVFMASSTISIMGDGTCTVTSGTVGCTLFVKDSTGNTLASVGLPSASTNTDFFTIQAFNNSSVSSQNYTAETPTGGGAGTANINTANSLTLFFVVAASANTGGGSNGTMALNRASITINP